ncbi:hypothetical protein [Psychrobacter sanguinis]|uniref:hypothetical protein n=1 Tax=Psychrobacter sanguinis TaxID=861445 RepID=UPI001918B79D|nr:hypothetical protein [Psychrobacter sanguinis]MCC3307484.1 hypothetical protein [Psychrobacter sanguinis]
MLIQTNLSAIKASRGTPVEVVEEWLAENGRIDSLPDNLVKGDSYFNNVNTKEIQKRQAENKKQEQDLQAALITAAGNVPKPKNKMIDVSDESFEGLRGQIKSRLFNGELVRVSDYKSMYAPSTMRVILSKITSDLKARGFEVITIQTETKINLGWMLESAFHDIFLTKANAEAVRRLREPLPKSVSSQVAYHQTIEDIAQRLLSGQFVRVDEYLPRHSRVVILRMVALAIKQAKELKDVVSINYKLGRKAGWVLESDVYEKLAKLDRCSQNAQAVLDSHG